MEISTSTNICAFTPGRERNGFDFCIAQCAQGGYKVLDINFCESMNPHSRMRNDDWQDYVKDIAEMGRRWGVVFRQSHLPYYDIFAENDEEKVKTMEELIRRSIIASAELGVEWTVTHPGTVYSAGPDVSVSKEKNLEYYSRHVATARENGGLIEITDSPKDLKDADVIYGDIWASMGEEDLIPKRAELLSPFRVTEETIKATGNPDVLYLHCLPSFHDYETKLAKEWKDKGVDIREVTDEVFRSRHSVVFDEAENRMHSIKAVLVATIGR